MVTASPTGGVDAAPGRDLAISVRDGKDAAAVNDLLGRGIELRRRADGTIVVPASARPSAIQVAGPLRRPVPAAPAGAPAACSTG